MSAADAQPAAVRYLRGLVQLVQSVGLSITAEGVRSTSDLALLWSLGFDAATGSALGASLDADVASEDDVATEPAEHAGSSVS